MNFWIHDGFLNWIHDGFMIDAWIHDTFFGRIPGRSQEFSDLSKCFETLRSSKRKGSLILGPK